MSATLSNISELCEFLKAEFYTNDFRPVKLDEYVKLDKQLFAVNNDALSLEEKLKFVHKVNFKVSNSNNFTRQGINVFS